MKTKGLCALLCVLLVLGVSALAEEWRLGDLIYVPERVEPDGNGAIVLRVEGLTYDEQQGTVLIPSLADAEFGVYVRTSTGGFMPWADPLSPAQPMRIRTGRDGARFALPRGIDFFLRQERAPEGYGFDAQAMIPIDVASGEIVVRNAMRGRLEVHVQDEMGAPEPGVTLTAQGAGGDALTAVTDAEGKAVFEIDQSGVYTVTESALPEGVFPAYAAFAENNAVPADDVSVQVNAAQLTQVSFVHPAAGSLLVTAVYRAISSGGEIVDAPLAGVRLSVQGAPDVVTDEEGHARVWLLAGEYGYLCAYEGDVDATLTAHEGSVFITASQTTELSLTAVQSTGRILAQATSAHAIAGGGVSFVNRETGAIAGPYAFDIDGRALSDALPAGEYAIDAIELPQDTQLWRVTSGEETTDDPQSLNVWVRPGELTEVNVSLRTWESQSFALLAIDLDDAGERITSGIPGEMTLDVLDERGETVAQVDTRDGMVTLNMLSGVYTLRMDEESAKNLHVGGLSRAVELPSSSAAVYFPAQNARLLLRSVDEQGALLSGAQYSITDGAGNTSIAWTDSNGAAVTGSLFPGEIEVVCLSAPAGHDMAAATRLHVEAGDAPVVRMEHPTYGTAELSVMLCSLDESGQQTLRALGGTEVRVSRVREGVAEPQSFTSGEDGLVHVQLPAGEYVAQTDDGTSGTLNAHFTVQNGQLTRAELVRMDDMGGLRVQLVGEEEASADFTLIAQSGEVYPLSAQGDAGEYYVGGLPAGEYVLRETRAPEGFVPVSDQSVAISGGEVCDLRVPLEEYAVLTVRKTGLVLGERFSSLIVPMEGEFALYTRQDGELQPYESEKEPLTIWAGVTAEQAAASGRTLQVKLPASIDGTTYYLKELNPKEGFTGAQQVYEVTLTAGETTTLDCLVVSDLGFFELDLLDDNGDHVAGSAFELLNSDGEVVTSFVTENTAYQSDTPLPSGTYLLRQTQPALGCTMAEESQREITIEPYLTQDGTKTLVAMSCLRIPSADEPLDLLDELYTVREGNVTMLCVDARRMTLGNAFHMPQLTISADAQQRTDMVSVVISGTSDGLSSRYAARVEYCLQEGGWQMSDARMTGALDVPAAVSLSDVKEDISAVRITYIDLDTGLEAVKDAFTPGQVTVGVRLGADESAQVHAQASFTGVFTYIDEPDGPLKSVELSQDLQLHFMAEGDGAFETAGGGRDGRISGTVFTDLDQNGLWGAQEGCPPYAVSVSLLGENGNVIESQDVDENGQYVFDGLAYGTYALQFDAGSEVVFSRGDGYTSHIVSGVRDERSGLSGYIVLDGEHTDVVVQAGCVQAARLGGTILKREVSGAIGGFEGLLVELRAKWTGEDEEPFVTMTGETGEFSFEGLMPGEYEMTLPLPEGMLCADATQGSIVRAFTLRQGDDASVGALAPLQAAASVRGTVHAQGANVKVSLRMTRDGRTEQVASTRTDDDGLYAFDGLFDGEYSVSFSAGKDRIFTRCGEKTYGFGTASSTGTTQSFSLAVGEALEGIDASAEIPAKLTVSVFEDPQKDGLFDGHEEMLMGVRLTLVRMEDGQESGERSITTGEDGNAVFEAIPAGQYKLRYLMPGAWRTTVNAAGESLLASFMPQSMKNTGESAPFTLAVGDTHLYIGAVQTGTISGVIYFDDDADADRDAGEMPSVQTRIELLDESGAVLSQATPNAQGYYVFDGLADGRYRVRFTAQEGSVFSGTERTMEQSGAQKSDGPVTTTRLIGVRAGSAVNTANAGVVRLISIEGRIWEDKDADRTQDEGERALSQVTVALMNGAGRMTLRSAKTNEQGGFSIEGLMPGDYMLRVEAPQGYQFSGSPDDADAAMSEQRGGNGYSAAFTLSGGTRLTDIGYGLYRPGSIAGRIWNDADYDGQMDEGESGIYRASVTLLDASGAAHATADTDRDGGFEFSGLAPGDYALRVTLPEGAVYTAKGGESLAPRQDERTAQLQVGTLAMGGAISGVNIGALEPAAIGGKVFVDANDDGRRDSEEAGLSGLRVTLDMTSGNDAGRQWTVLTDADGQYAFSGVMPGEARLTFELPEGMMFSKQVPSRGSIVPQTDAQVAQSGVFTVNAGEERDDMDAGAIYAASLNGTVWNDEDYDGKRGNQESGVLGAWLLLLDAQGNIVRQTHTDNAGGYAFDDLRVGAYQLRVELPGGMIFTREGHSAIANEDESIGQCGGIKLSMGEHRDAMDIGAMMPGRLTGRVRIDDGTLHGLERASVTLLQDATAVASVTTTSDGQYAFERLRPGSYRVRIALPQDTLFAEQSLLSLADRDAKEGLTMTVRLGIGQTVELYDVETVKTGSIHGCMWDDADVSGTMDAGESALARQNVELILIDDAGETVISTAQTGADGRYSFTDLRAGTYALSFTLPQGMLFTDVTGAEGGSRVPVSAYATGRTDAFTLAVGQTLSQMNAGGILPGIVGDTVWVDTNGNGLQDYKEPQMPGIAITLLQETGDGVFMEVASTVSDEYGFYRFESLRPGRYAIRVDASSPLTGRVGAPLGEIDSDVDPQTHMSDVFMLYSAQALRNVDVGLAGDGR